MEEIKLNSLNNTYFFPSISSIKMELMEGEECSFFINDILLKLRKGEEKEIDINNNTTLLTINSELNKNDFSLEITTKENETETKYKVLYERKISTEKNFYEEHQQNINTNKTSFMVLRTNPKLTGNIKIVIDEQSNLFLDTFQINSILSQKRYRHIPISSNSIFSNDIRNYFKDVPKTILFDIGEENYNIFSPKRELNKQYIDTYFYGVKNNFDKLYSENFSILAPLYINNILPDFFIIFKVEGATNNIKLNKKNTDLEIFNDFINKGKIIKTFDLRENTSIGTYLRNIQKDIIEYPTSVYMSMDQYNHNQWTGISIDRGVITTATESGYSLTDVKNQVDYDRYVTNGFERNGLISSRLINLEFMFNDKESEDFKINRYFGLYIINHKIKDVYEFTDKDKTLNEFLSSENKIINIIDDNQINNFKRVKNIIEYNNILNNNKKAIGDNVLTDVISYNDIKNTKIMNVNLIEPLSPGEHLRIIDKDKKNIYEVIVSKYDSDIDKEYIINYEKINDEEEITYHRNIIKGYTSINKITIEEQIKDLVNTFKEILPNNIEVYSFDNDINFIIKNNKSDFYFQRISSRVLYDYEYSADLKNITTEDNKVRYFDEIIPNVLLNVFSEEDNTDNQIFLPTHFKSWNNRLTYIIKFIGLDNKCTYNISKKIDIQENLLYNFNNNENYEPLPSFKIIYKNKSLNGESSIIKNIIKSPNTKNNYIVQTNITEDLLYEKINLYTYNKLQLSIAGIIPIKDFNFDVIDDTNIVQLGNHYQKIKGVDEYSQDKTINGVTIKNIRKGTSPENFYQYIELNSNDNIFDNANCLEYMNNIYNKTKKMDISLLVPTNCKWKIYGKDLLNNDIKSSPFSPQAYSYYLQYTNSNYNIFCNELEEKYELTSLVNKGEESYISIREYLLNGDGNPFDILDSNYFTKIYYNINSNSLDVIYAGQKIQLHNKLLDLSVYDGYNFALVKSKSNLLNNSPIEFIFDEKNEVILGIWYIGNINSENNNWKKINAITDTSNIFNNKYIPFINSDSVNIKNKEIFISLLNNEIPEKENSKRYTYNFIVNDINNYAISGLNDTSFYPSNNYSNVYINDSSNEIDIKNNLITFKNILTNTNANIFIKNDNLIENTINMNFISPINIRETLPLKILSNNSNDYFSYNGYIQPEFKNIFEFENIDKEISEYTGIKFVGSNTKISKINNINQLWINKISDDANYSYDSLDKQKALFSIDLERKVSVVRDCWSKNFYKKYNRNKKIKYIDGYESDKDVKTFFGSHAMVINQKEITITDWTKFYTKRNSNKLKTDNVVIKINITDALLNYLKINTNITNNWIINNHNYLKNDDYINNIIENTYNINLNNNIEIYKSMLRGDDLSIIPYKDVKGIIKINNTNINLIKENNKYFLNIEFNKEPYNYMIKYTIKK